MATKDCNGCNEEMTKEVNGTLKQFDRNKYFYGKLMTVRDFELEQSYFNEKRHLLNRLIHGVGIACGLQVTITEGQKIKISPGVALDCWGREIVVDKEYIELNVTGTLGAGDKGYLYIKQKPCLKDPVPVLSNASTCEQECCYSRIKEDFEVVVSKDAPPAPEFLLDVEKYWYWKKDVQGQGYKDVNPKEGDIELLAKKIWEERGDFKSNEADWYEAKQIIAINEYLKEVGCPSCNDPKVLLAVIEKKADGSIGVNDTETHKYRSIVYNNPMLYDLISSHLVDFNNPHKVTAQQTGAIKSIENLGNPGGNINLEKQNAITITTETPSGADPIIRIGENHSANEGNPHNVTAEQTGAIKSIGSVSNPGGNVDLVQDNAIVINSDDPNNRITIGENHSYRTDNPHGTTAVQVGALISIDGVSNPGGNVDIVAGKNITITPGYPDSTSITIASTLDKVLQTQLGWLFMYLRERALKCTVINFKGVGERFNNKIALKLSMVAKKAVDKKTYEKEEEFVEIMREILELQVEIAGEIKDLATDESLESFRRILDELEKAIGKRDSLNIATVQDEVCFYAMLLERKPLTGIAVAPNLDREIYNRFNYKFVEAIPDEIRDKVKAELENVNTATILNVISATPNIMPQELEKRTGLKIRDIDAKIKTLVEGRVLSGDATNGYRLKI